MDAFLIFCCVVTGLTSIAALLYAVVKTEGVRVALCVLLGSCSAMATIMLVAWLIKLRV